MIPACHGQLLVGIQGLPLPESDPRCPLTPDSLAGPEFIEIEGQGLCQKLYASVSSKLHRMLEQQREEEEHRHNGLGGKAANASLSQTISSMGPPVNPRQPPTLLPGPLVPPPAEVQPHQAALGAPPGLGEPSSPARAVVSVGSLGHPHACKEACKHFKHKMGCLMEASCDLCHLCHWQRKGKELVVQLAVEPAPPPPAAAHPRPATRQTGTAPLVATDAAAPAVPRPPLAASSPLAEASLSQPAVSWEEPAYGGAVATDAAGGAEAAPFAASVGTLVSLGSVGHPRSCGQACKYASKPKRGCLEGRLCQFCHLCRWTRQNRSKKLAYAAGLS